LEAALDTLKQGGFMISGVKVKQLRVIPDERGRLMEILRCDDEHFTKFGQVYMTTAYPRVVKGWHYHLLQDDSFTAVKGMIKLVLYDRREGSPTHGEINEFYLGEYRPLLVQIPAGVAHGFKTIGVEEAIIVNTVTEPYNYDEPDEFRISLHDSTIPYDWSLKEG
jgi:dTDP-4-dehydrorhamnose 3,5-epimerase